MRKKVAKKLKDISQLIGMGKSEAENKRIYKQMKQVHKNKSKK